MNAAEITAAVRRDIREPSAITISDTQITAIVALGADRIWEALLKSDPTKGKERVSLSSTTNVFSLPSDCHKIYKVWDMKDNADSVEAATNASNIELTLTAHEFEDEQIVRVHDVGGNTAANGVWEVTAAATDTLELSGSTGNDAYTSGGKIFQESNSFREMVEIDVEEASYHNEWQYFLRSGEIVVDYPTFSNDLVLDYARNYSTLTDIPAKYHIGLVSYAVVNTMRIPSKDSPNYEDIHSMLSYHTNRLNSVFDSIYTSFGQSARPKRHPQGIHWECL